MIISGTFQVSMEDSNVLSFKLSPVFASGHVFMCIIFCFKLIKQVVNWVKVFGGENQGLRRTMKKGQGLHKRKTKQQQQQQTMETSCWHHSPAIHPYNSVRIETKLCLIRGQKRTALDLMVFSRVCNTTDVLSLLPWNICGHKVEFPNEVYRKSILSAFYFWSFTRAC